MDAPPLEVLVRTIGLSVEPTVITDLCSPCARPVFTLKVIVTRGTALPEYNELARPPI